MRNREDIFQILSEVKPQLQRDFSLNSIGVFGSFAKNEYNENSDLDILIETSKPIGWKLLSLQIYLEKLINIKVDLTTKNALKSQLKDEILNSVIYI
jgi:predicted nucleotidyltransferase